MKRSFATVVILILMTISVAAQGVNTYIVQPGDSMWKIAVKYQIGLSEIISANTQVKNPALIYPNQKLNIPNIDDIKKLETEVVRLVNIERTNRGLKALTQNWELSRVARVKSQDMVNKGYFSHTSPTYGSPFDIMKKFGIKYSSAGENIAKGQRTPKDVMNGWMNSTGHRNNILSNNFTQIGVGVARLSNGTYVWTQMFIRP